MSLLISDLTITPSSAHDRYIAKQCKHLSSLILVAGSFVIPLIGQITPTTPTVTVGGNVTLTSTTAVAWSLSGSGSLSTLGPSTSTVYTAPSSVVPKQTLQGCPVLPNDSVFSTRIDDPSFPLNANASTWLAGANMTTLGITIFPSWGINYSDATTPTVNIVPYYGDDQGNNPSYTTPFPGRATVKRESGAYVASAVDGGDHHTVTVKASSCDFYEYYNDLITLSGADFSLTEACRYTGSTCNASSAILPYKSTTFKVPSMSTDAAGLPLAPLTWTLADIKAGPTHATRFTLPIGYINSATYLWPATHYNGANPSATPYGARFRLKSHANGGPDPNVVCSSGSGTNNDCLHILTGLQQYGMFLADIGLGGQIEVSSDITQDPTTRSALLLVQSANILINTTNWDVVDESSLQETTAHGYQLPGTFGSYAVDPVNGHVVPANYAVVTGGSTKVSIAIEGIGIGLKSNALAIAAGMTGYQIPFWITGSTNQTAIWSIVSGVGSITSGGVYTPPASTTGGNTAVLKATANADSNVLAYVYVGVLLNNSGTYSVDIDSLPFGSTTTSAGKTWNTDFGLEVSAANFYPYTDYPAWTGTTESTQYGSYLYTYGGDIDGCWVVPNGNYKVRWGQGNPWNGSGGSPAQFTVQQELGKNPDFVVVNGTIVAHFYDWAVPINRANATPSDIFVPAKVTSNSLCTSTRNLGPTQPIPASSGLAPLYWSNGAMLYPQFTSGCTVGTSACGKSSAAELLEIIPDASSPHWTIDAQGAATIKPGQSIQLYVIDWYTGTNNPTWSIVSDPTGLLTVSSTGLLAMANTGATAQPISVKATNGTYSATLSLSAGGTAYGSWGHSRTVTVNHLKVPNTSQVNFPMLFSGTYSYLATIANGGGVSNANGYDIIFASDAAGTNKLKFERTAYNAVTGQVQYWVQISTLSPSSDTTIYLLYGNSGISTDQSNKTGTWPTNYKSVWHLDEATGTNLADSTSNDNAAQKSVSTDPSAVAGEIGGAQQYVNTGNFAATPAGAKTDITTTGIKISALMNPTAANLYGGIYRRSHVATDSFAQVNLMINNTYGDITYTLGGTNFTWSATGYTAVYPLSTWSFVTLTHNYSTGAVSLYLNGSLVSTQTGATTPASAANYSDILGNRAYGVGDNSFPGVLDEIRVSQGVLSADWIAAEFNNQNSPSTFYTVGP